MSDRLLIVVIYEEPVDYPGQYVARRHWVDETGDVPDAEPLAVGTLAEVRLQLPPGMVRVNRSPHDEPQILETWI